MTTLRGNKVARGRSIRRPCVRLSYLEITLTEFEMATIKGDANRKTTDPAANPDPITKTPGAHPVGSGVGAAAGGVAGIGAAIATGAAIGTAAGPIGTAAGAVVGGVVGGLVGSAVGEKINPSVEHEYWRKTYTTRPYTLGSSYDDFGPAYQYGWESRGRYAGKNFVDIESDLGRDWEKSRGQSKLGWDRASLAARDAWERIDEMD